MCPQPVRRHDFHTPIYASTQENMVSIHGVDWKCLVVGVGKARPNDGIFTDWRGDGRHP